MEIFTSMQFVSAFFRHKGAVKNLYLFGGKTLLILTKRDILAKL